MTEEGASVKKVHDWPAEDVLAGFIFLAALSAAIIRPTGWPVFTACYLAAIFLFTGLRYFPIGGSRSIRGLRTVFPLLLFAPLYTGTGLSSSALPHWILSDPLERLEAAVFAGQPSMYLAERLPSLALSEILHAAYVSYYLLVAALPLALLLAGRSREAAGSVFALCLGFSLCNLCYIWLPVASPFFIYPPIGLPLSEGFFYRLAHGISNRGGVLGGAFPSSHAALTVINLMMAFRLHRRLFWWTLAPSVLLLISTVYCRYHYALDTLAGVALAAAVAAFVWLMSSGSVPSKLVKGAG